MSARWMTKWMTADIVRRETRNNPIGRTHEIAATPSPTQMTDVSQTLEDFLFGEIKKYGKQGFETTSAKQVDRRATEMREDSRQEAKVAKRDSRD
jgi:hypothetical protein